METKTYRVKNMHEAVELVREELGPAASILHARRIDNRWRSLLGREPVLEVVASPDANVPSRFPSPMTNQEPNDGVSTSDTSAEYPRLANLGEEKTQRADTIPVEHEPAHDAETNVRSHRDWLLKADFTDAALEWLGDRIDPEFRTNSKSPSGGEQVGENTDTWLDRPATIEETSKALEPHIRIAGRLFDRAQKEGPLVVAFVGPTGVGKTTTLAKIAAEFHVRRGQRVGLITIDTYRIAAVEQLRTYADIIDIPMEVVSNESEMLEARERLQSSDLILIDTSGQSPKDVERMQELTRTLNSANPDEVMLVLSCMASSSGFKRAVESFSPTGATSIVLSKIDEADALGHLWMPLLESKLPIRYLTTGQDVPDDIELADEQSVSAAILHIDRYRSFMEAMEDSHA